MAPNGAASGVPIVGPERSRDSTESRGHGTRLSTPGGRHGADEVSAAGNPSRSGHWRRSNLEKRRNIAETHACGDLTVAPVSMRISGRCGGRRRGAPLVSCPLPFIARVIMEATCVRFVWYSRQSV